VGENSSQILVLFLKVWKQRIGAHLDIGSNVADSLWLLAEFGAWRNRRRAKPEESALGAVLQPVDAILNREASLMA